MTPIQQCLQSLAVLAESDDLNGISLAESKIDEFVRTAGTESAWQIVALDDLKHEITTGDGEQRARGTCWTISPSSGPRSPPSASRYNDRPPQTPARP
jgi:hypothetical protein